MQRTVCRLPLLFRLASPDASLFLRRTVLCQPTGVDICQFGLLQRRLHHGGIDSDPGRYKIATIPNALCLLRIGATPLIGSLVLSQNYTPAFSLFVVAGLTDLMDGYIARNFKGQRSLLGSVLDPVADKLLVSVLFVTMTHVGLIPVPLTAVVLLRDFCLISGGFYKRFKTMDPPYSLNRFFNPEVSSIQIVPTLVSKANTVLQLCVVAFSLAGPVFDGGEMYKQGIYILNCVTAATTIYSGLQYAGGAAFQKL